MPYSSKHPRHPRRCESVPWQDRTATDISSIPHPTRKTPALPLHPSVARSSPTRLPCTPVCQRNPQTPPAAASYSYPSKSPPSRLSSSRSVTRARNYPYQPPCSHASSGNSAPTGPQADYPTPASQSAADAPATNGKTKKAPTPQDAPSKTKLPSPALSLSQNFQTRRKSPPGSRSRAYKKEEDKTPPIASPAKQTRRAESGAALSRASLETPS